jgi:hypothetical protein
MTMYWRMIAQHGEPGSSARRERAPAGEALTTCGMAGCDS